MTTVLGLFAKWPEAGQVKTRLAGSTSPEFAAAVAGAFLDDSLERLAQVPARRVLAFAPAEASERFAARAQGAFELAPQSTGDLGERMADFFARRFAEGAPDTTSVLRPPSAVGATPAGIVRP